MGLRIGIVTSWFERGAAYVSRQYVDQLRSSHDVFIYSRGGEREARGNPEWDQPFVTWGRTPIVDDPSAVDLKDFTRWVERNRIDCVFFNEQRSWPAVTWCARNGILNGAYVVHYREDTIPFFDCHDFLICNARHHYDVFRSHEQAVFIPWGTDLRRFRPREAGPAHPGRLTFFHSAGMNPYRKGTDLVLEAFANLPPSSVPAHLVLHSQVNLDKDLPQSSAILRNLEARGLVTLIDRNVPCLAELYRMGDVCVYPTRHEGLGLTIAESLASGLPILVTDQEPVSEHVDGQVVRTIAVRRRVSREDGDYWPRAEVNVAALTEEMRSMLHEYRELPDLQRKARQKAEEVTDWSKNSQSLGEQFANFRRIDSERKRKAVVAAEQYDRRKWVHGLRNWVGYQFPEAVRAVRMVR
jgi:glycosyltransferase involved in cell wall biosynthesis